MSIALGDICILNANDVTIFVCLRSSVGKKRVYNFGCSLKTHIRGIGRTSEMEGDRAIERGQFFLSYTVFDRHTDDHTLKSSAIFKNVARKQTNRQN